MSSAQAWFTRIEFNETGMPGFPTSTTTLANTTTPSWMQSFDVLNKGAAICNGPNAFIYTENGGDSINDMTVTVTRVTNTGNAWTQIEGDYATTSSGSWRSDFSINDQQSAPNDFGYIKVEVAFLGDLPTSICPSLLNLRHTSTNGSSEAYEWTLVSINDNLTAAEEALIGTYQNINYSDVSASTYFDSTGAVVNIAGATNTPLPNGTSISEHITGLTDVGTQGGFLRPGLWTIDDFNTTILDGPEAVGTNPDAGNGATNDNQTINGVADLGLSVGTPINKITYYFGLTDVAFDTDNDGDTRTNSLPAAAWTWMELGFPTPPTITSTSGNCIDSSGTATITVADGTPSFILSGDLDDTSATSPINISGLTQGTYNFTLTDSKGCMVSDSVMITAPCAVLPVDLLSFNGEVSGTTNKLNWVTATEINNSHFIIERSADGINFEEIGSVNGQIHSASLQTYSFLDREPLLGTNYYKLRQIDFDNQASFSNVIKVKRDDRSSSASFYLQNGNIVGLYYAAKISKGNLMLYSLNGQLLHQEEIHLTTGHNKFSIENSNVLTKGIYIIQFDVNRKNSSVSKILLK
jgi:hypothetical protein